MAADSCELSKLIDPLDTTKCEDVAALWQGVFKNKLFKGPETGHFGGLGLPRGPWRLQAGGGLAPHLSEGFPGPPGPPRPPK